MKMEAPVTNSAIYFCFYFSATVDNLQIIAKWADNNWSVCKPKALF